MTTRPTGRARRAQTPISHDFGYDQQLRRSLSLGDLLIYGLVFMVPIAPFAIFGIVFNASKGMVPLTYLIGLVAMVFTALSYREMSRAFPIAGSVYAYAGRGLHPSAGFLAGLGDPARLSARPDAVLRGWRRRHARRSCRRSRSRCG